MNFDAFLAAVLAGVLTLAAILFWPWIADELPESILAAGVYLIGAAVVSGSSLLVRSKGRRRKPDHEG